MRLIPGFRLLYAITSVLLTFSFAAFAGEPPVEPMLRIEPGEHTAIIRRIAVDGQGRWLVTASHDKTARIWSLSDGRLLATLRPPIGLINEGQLNAVALSPDGAVVAVAGWTQFNQGKDYDTKEGQSIYLFDRANGKMTRRIPGLRNVVSCLTFSPDGRWLAATMVGTDGVRIFSTVSGQLLAEDHYYGNSSYSVDFSIDGRLVTTSEDGMLRLYRFDGSRLALQKKRAAPGGRLPHIARFSPDGQSIAVGFSDTVAVNVLDGNSLVLSYAPDSSGVTVNLQNVTWSRDGAILFASGRAEKNGQHYIRRWGDRGVGKFNDWPIVTGGIFDMVSLPGERLAFCSGDPSWGVVDTSGKKVLFHAPVTASLQGNPNGFRLSNDGTQVRFGYGKEGQLPVVLDSLSRTFLAAETAGLTSPLLTANGIVVTDWENNATPMLNGNPIKLDPVEISRSMAIWPKGNGFVLGTEWNLRSYTKGGSLRWKQKTPGTAWSVNASTDGRWIVAAYSDGTIRWHSVYDGVEQLAFFPHGDRKRWIIWTPEGYFDASPDGAELIGYHINQGQAKEAKFIKISNLYDVFYRPDIIQAKMRGEDISSLITMTAAEALKTPPPEIKFTTVPAKSASAKAKVCYQVKSTGGGIGEVRLFQNGKLIKSDGFYRETVKKESASKVMLASQNSRAIYQEQRGLAVKDKKSASTATTEPKGDLVNDCVEIETMTGENEISVAAFNAPNTVQGQIETTTFTSTRKSDEPHLYILSVGIDKYQDSSIDLKYATKDATDFIAKLPEKARSIYKPKNIHLTTLTDRQAGKQNIMNAIKELSTKIKHGDSFIFFNASHGVLLQNQYYIVTADFDGNLDNTKAMISSNEIVEMSKGIKSLSQLFIFDTCHAGGVDNIVSGLYDARMVNLAKKMGLHIYASAGSVQTALDGYQGNGLYTHTLLQGLNNGKDVDKEKSGNVTVKNLGLYTREKTTEISSRLGHPQTPFIINFGRDNPLFTVSGLQQDSTPSSAPKKVTKK
jgi:WD40 repeat protein